MSAKPQLPQQFKVIFLGNGQKYDSEYVQTDYVQQIFKKRGWSKQPFTDTCKSQILSLCLIQEGVWFDKSWSDIEWAFGPYMDIFGDSMQLKNPIYTAIGTQNVIPLKDELWAELIEQNPEIIIKIKSWKILYSANLIDFQHYSDIRLKVLRMPWGYLGGKTIKNMESRKSNNQWKIQDWDETVHLQITCRQCYNRSKRCSRCMNTIGIWAAREKRKEETRQKNAEKRKAKRTQTMKKYKNKQNNKL